MSTKQTVYVLLYGHKRGQDLFVTATAALARETAEAIVEAHRGDYEEFEDKSSKEVFDAWNDVTEEWFEVHPEDIITEGPIQFGR